MTAPTTSILITGSSGFLGRHFAAAATERGWHVTGVDIVPGEYTSDVADARDFLRRIPGQFDYAIHCAAIVGGRQTIDNHPAAQIVDFALDAEFVNWCVRTRPRRGCVYLSSSAAYGHALQHLGARRALEEWMAATSSDGLLYEPDALYGWTKLTGERMVLAAQRAGLDNVLVLRPFSGYGSDQSTDYPFAAIVERVRRRENPLHVWGGDQVRDFVHVDDIVAATFALLDAGVYRPVNIGTGTGTTMRGLASLAAMVAGYSPEIIGIQGQPQGVGYRVAHTGILRQWYDRSMVPLGSGIERALRVTAETSR